MVKLKKKCLSKRISSYIMLNITKLFKVTFDELKVLNLS